MLIAYSKNVVPYVVPHLKNFVIFVYMGWGIYTKSGVNKEGKTSLYYKVTSGRSKVFKRALNIKLKPADWDKRTLQVSAKVDNSIFINEKLDNISTRLKRGWNFFESGNYTWNEMIAFLSGDYKNNQGDLYSFIESTIKPKVSKEGWRSYKGTYGSVLKALGKDSLDFKDLTEDTVDELFSVWKKTLRSASIKTNLYHFGAIINAAHKKRLTPYRYVKETKWRKKKEKTNTQGQPYVETARWEVVEQAIGKCKTLMDIEAVGFWLLMFGMRGLYPSDLCAIHEAKWDFHFDHPVHGNATILFHTRHKSDELMWIKYEYPFNDLQRKLRGYLELTHGYRINVKTGKEFLKTKEYTLSKNERSGWFFKEYNKSQWNTISKKCRPLGLPPFKIARKTFETYALQLKVRSEIRDKLLGHATIGVKQNYQDWQWDELQNEVHEAHELVLANFHIDTLYPALIKKADEILKKMGIPPKVFNNYHKCEKM